MKIKIPVLRRTYLKRAYLLWGGAALCLALAVLLLILFSGKEPVLYTYGALSPFREQELQKLVLRENATGELLETAEREEIAAFLELLADLSFKEERAKGEVPAWTHLVDLYRDGENYLRLVFAGEYVVFIVFEEGEKIREGKFIADTDLTPRLETYFAWLLAAQEEREKALAAAAEEEPPLKVTREEIEPAICVVINNYPSARPSSGLQQADIVYEFLVEGGITRYLAVYKRKHLENFDIGPVRSLRPYFAVQSLEYGGIVAHSGYSARTAQMIAGLGLFQIGDDGRNFWRDRTRKAPDNLYTSMDNLYRACLNRIQPVQQTYELDPALRPGYTEGKSINIDYAQNNRVSYLYDEKEEVYYRFINDKPHTDRETGLQYYAERVIIREAAHRNIPGPELLVDIDLEGAGKGVLYEKGLQYQITWEYQNRVTSFYYAPGEPVKPIPGPTWIQVVRR